MPPQHVANLALHIGAGILALLLGLVPLFTRKGSTLHRRWGRRFAILAVVVVGTAILSDIFNAPPAALVAVTLSAAYQFIGGLRSLALRNASGPTAFDGAISLTALAIAAVILFGNTRSTLAWPRSIEYVTLGYVALVALYDLSRFAWSPLWCRSIRPLDHGLKFTGLFVAMASAGTGNLLRNVQPLGEILPPVISAAGLIAMTFIALRYLNNLRVGNAASHETVKA